MRPQDIVPLCIASLSLLQAMPASAQQTIGPPPTRPAPTKAAPAQPATQNQAQTSWEKMPRMELQETFGGPLRDTIIQRWKDTASGATCYIYLPINAPHSAQTPSGYVQYGAATIGSISCLPGEPTRPAAPARR